MKTLQIYFTEFRRVLAIVLVIFAISGVAYLQQAQAATGINSQINFQGKVVNKTAGTNVTNGNYDFTFRLYDAASSGTLLWTENWTGGNQVTVTDGIFRVALGSLTSLSSVDFNSDSLYLDITFNGESMGTRVRFSAVPYAFNAQKVNGLSVTNNGGNTLNIAASKTFTVSNSLTLTGTDSTSFAFPSTGGGTVIVSNISGQSIAGAFSLTGASGDLTLAGTTGLTFSGAGGDITFTNGEKIDNDVNGTIAVTGDLDASGAFTAGTGNAFAVNSSGAITASAGLVLTSGAITLGGVTGSGQCLVGGTNASWGSCGAGGTNYWNFGTAAGAYSPINGTGDLLLGFGASAPATSSARFSVLNMTGTNTVAVASVSAQNAAGQALSLVGDGTIQSLRNGTLTLGGSTTGNIILSPRNGSGFVGLGTSSPTDKLTIAGGGVTFTDDNQGLTFFGGITLIKASGGNLVTNGSFQGTSLVGTTSLISPLLTTSSNANLTLTPNGTGQMLLTSDFNSGVQIGSALSATPLAPLYINNGIGNNAALIVNNPNSGNLIVASASGTTKFTIDTNGVMTAAGGLTLTSGPITLGGVTGSGQCIVGGASAAWGSCGGGSGTNYWNLNSSTGLLTPINGTLDLLLGFGASTPATASAKFALTGMAGNGPAVASIAGNMIIQPQNGAGGRLGIGLDPSIFNYVIDATKDINDATTINVWNPNAGSAAWSGFRTGTAQSSSADLQMLYTGFNQGGSALNRIANSGLIQAGSGASGGLILVSNNTSAPMIFATGGNALANERMRLNSSGLLGIGTTSPSSVLHVTRPLTLSVTGKSLVNFDQLENQDILTASASGSTRLSLDRNGLLELFTADDANGFVHRNANGSVRIATYVDASRGYMGTLGNSDFQLYVNDGAGVLQIESDSIASQSNLVSIGQFVEPIAQLHVSRGQDFTGKALTIFDQIEDQDIFAASSSGSTVFMMRNYGDLAINTTTAGGWSRGMDFTRNNGDTSVGYFGAFGTAGTTTHMFIAGNSDGWAAPIAAFTPTGNVGLGTTNSSLPSSALFVTRNLTNYAATGKALAIFNQTETQDVLTASASGTTVFSITRNGGISLSTSEGVGNSGECLKSQGAGSASIWDSCGGSSGTNYFNQQNGLTWIGNTTTDFAIGGNSTSSAKFVFGGMNAGTPIATFSGDLILNNKPTTAVTDMQKWNQITGTAGTIGGNATTGIASISASVVYNGSLYVGTSKSNGAEVYRLDNGSTWTRVTNSQGQITASGTQNIDMVSSMTVWNGSLYIGTTEPNSAEIYRYSGGTTWVKVSQTTAGTIRSGGTAAIDGISSMVVHQSKMYVGTLEGAKAEVYRYESGTSWIIISTTAGTYVTSNVVNVDAITSMVSYQGSLYLMTKKTNDADFLRWTGVPGANGQWPQLDGGTTTSSYAIYNTENGTSGTVTNSDEGQLIIYAGRIVLLLSNFGSTGDILMWNPNSVATTTNTFIRFNAASGQIATGGTSNIDGFGSAAIYNGRLYVGTSETNSAQIYRYNGAMGDWTLISQNTAGQIQGGGTTGIDSVSTMIQYNHNSLFAGILEGTATQGYQYSSSIDQSYALKFNAFSENAGGEQNLNENLGQIFFVASLSANLNNRQGNTGAFVFSHNIVTNNGSYDVAEDYPTRDETLEPGDLVSVDTNERGFVKKSDGAYDYSTIGVYSENPALRLSQNNNEINGGKVLPVALAGRVPVKVSTENGKIKSGDALTSSSQPGVAMKAKKAGVVIGVAMADYEDEGIGKITAYIKSTSYNGNLAATFASIEVNSESFASDALNQLMAEGSDGKSSVVTDRVIAGLEVVTPKITADTIIARKIKVDELELPANFFENALKSGGVKINSESKEIAVLKEQISVLNTQTLDASVSAEITKSKLLESINEKLILASNSATVPSNGLSLRDLNVDGLMIFNDSIRVKNNGLFEGMLTVVDTITTNDFISNGVSTFFGKSIFKDETSFEKPVTFSSDIGGQALVKKNAEKVEVTFEKEFEQTPVINASVSFEEEKDSEGNVKDNQLLIDKYFAEKYAFVIVGKSKKGFTIVLNKKAADDVSFTWTALRVKDAKTIQSRGPN